MDQDEYIYRPEILLACHQNVRTVANTGKNTTKCFWKSKSQEICKKTVLKTGKMVKKW